MTLGVAFDGLRRGRVRDQCRTVLGDERRVKTRLRVPTTRHVNNGPRYLTLKAIEAMPSQDNHSLRRDNEFQPRAASPF